MMMPRVHAPKDVLPGPPVELKPEEKAVFDALRAKVTTLLEAPISVRTLLEVEQTARLARDLLLTWSAPEAMRARNPHGTAYGSVYNGGPVGFYSGGPVTLQDTSMSFGMEANVGSSDPQLGPPGAIVPGNRPENFGAQIIRELLAARGAKDEKQPSELIAAIALAREKGMEDIAKRLEAELFGEKPPSKDQPEEKAA